MTYRYADEDPRPVRGRYFYAPFEGRAFLDAYRRCRRETIAALSAVAARTAGPDPVPARGGMAVPVPGTGPVDTLTLLRALDGPDTDPVDTAAWLGVLARKVEVGRRLRARYAADLRPGGDEEAPFEGYARLGALLARAAAGTAAGSPDLGHLSTLLKVGDILCHVGRARPDAHPAGAASIAADALELELALVAGVERRGLPCPDRPLRPLRFAAEPSPPAAARASRPRVVLLAADTGRARAYLDLLAAAGRPPDAAILVELSGPPAPAAPPVATPLFDNLTPLPAALVRAGVPATRLAVDRLEAPEVLAAIEAAAPALVVIAPPGGVILAPAFFAIEGARYLHVHPGRVPAFRGSTPMYYALLAEGRLAATALLLDAGIDTGAVVAEREFEPPADLATIDGAFDPWMRAVLLRDVLAAAAAGVPLAGRPQPDDGARTYHVIHPVLRHVALLGRAAIATEPKEGPAAP